MCFVELETFSLFVFRNEGNIYPQNEQVPFRAGNYVKNVLIFMPLSPVLFQGAGHRKLYRLLFPGAFGGTLSTQLAALWCSLIPSPWNGGACE